MNPILENIHKIESDEAKSISSLLEIISDQNKENFSHDKLLSDGNYIVNHNSHPVGVREREIKIEKGLVVSGKHEFSQSFFFEVNHVIRKI